MIDKIDGLQTNYSITIYSNNLKSYRTGNIKILPQKWGNNI